ncbi:MAG: PD-(D/E)XK nuclease family protein [Syntrophaceae bacterium]|nr:PD-(D/E)XK nuclease family protein [Syntrophaceae bacterium]
MLKKETSKEAFERYIHISYSQLKTYLTCPQKYEFQYVMGLPWEFIPEYFPFGKAIHEAAKIFYRTLKETGRRPTLEDTTEHFKACWDKETQVNNIRYKENQSRDTLRDKGAQLVKVFYENVAPQRIIGVEVPFSVDMVLEETGEVLPCKLAGIFDLIESDEEGNFIIVELKTGAKRFTDDQIDLDLQGTLYSYALRQMGYQTDGEETLVRYDQLLKLKNPDMETYYAVKGNVHYIWAYTLVRKVLKAVNNEIFFPIPGWQCKECPFGTTCQQEK